MRIALGIEYCGRTFTGWQSQPDGRGVQNALERALAVIADAAVGTVAAGRTDTGVHATMQVVHFDSAAPRPDTAWVRGVNSNLSPDIAVLWAQPVAGAFHARYAAVRRHYTYLLCSRPARPGSPRRARRLVPSLARRRCDERGRRRARRHARFFRIPGGGVPGEIFDPNAVRRVDRDHRWAYPL